MLPHALSSDICSLVEGQDRLTQTAVIELDARGRVLRTAFHDGVIRSAARLSYQQAQAIVDGDAAARERFAPLVARSSAMDELAKLMRARRYERGSLDFDLPEPKLVLDASGEMTGIVRHERLDSMRLIEEFMLAANEAVAEALHRRRRGRALPHPRAARPRARSRSSASWWPRSATACRRTWRRCGPRTSS